MAANLTDFWPRIDSVAQALGTQAQAQATELFLAVHQPMFFDVRAVGSTTSETRTEHELLEALTKEPGPAKTIILPILGDSGIGKSHAVRWLKEQLKLRENSGYHVVWVPRGESLKQTLRRVLAALEGTPQHAELSDALESANELPVSEVRGRLRTALVDQLLHPSDDLRRRVGENLFEFVEDSGKGLAALLQDPASSWDHFETDRIDPAGGRGAISRLCRHITEYRSREEDQGELDRKFVPRDLLVAPELQQRMGLDARNFCGQLQAHDEIRAASLAILNEVLDAAKNRSLELGGIDLLSLFRRFRGELQRAGKELVLLIEDFTIMSGLQGALYDLMVQTPQAEEEDICTLRTAFALTPGYMQGQNLPENVRTRAGVEWHVTGGHGRSEWVRHSVNLVGAYLNAARVGVSRLKDSGPEARVDPSDEMHSQDRQILEAFGQTENKHWLFPFNRPSLEALMDLQMPQVDYNPRLLLENVVKPVLQQRGLFEEGEFPSPRTGEDPAAQVALEITKRVPKQDLRRYFRIVNIWGGRPRQWSDVEQIPAEVFLAFGLEPLEGLQASGGGQGSHTGSRDGQTSSSASGSTGSQSGGALEAPAADDFPELEAWRISGTRLPQGMAAAIRKQVAELLLANLPNGWAGLPAYPAGKLQSRVFIPNSPGNLLPDEAFVCVAREEKLKNPVFAVQVERELSAVLRWDAAGGMPNYAGARQDLPLIQALVRRLSDEAARWLRDRPLDYRRRQNPTQELVQVHLFVDPLRGRLGGAQRRTRVRALFPSFSSEETTAKAWDDLRKFLSDQFSNEMRGGLSGALATLVCAFQGSSGRIPLSLDVAALWADISAIGDGLPPTLELENAPASPAIADLERVLRRLRSLVENLAVEVSQHREPATTVLEWTGGLPNTAVIGEILNLANQALEHGISIEAAKAIKDLLPEFGREGSQSITDAARGLLDVETPLDGEALDRVQTVDWRTLILALDLRRSADRFLDEVEEFVDLQAPGGSEGADETVKRLIAGQLDEIEILLRDEEERG